MDVSISTRIKPFDTLGLQELYSILRLRADIFIVEQDCVYQDLDDKDQQAHHLMLFRDKKLIAYSRILAPGTSYPAHSSIGRVVVDRSCRAEGLGKLLMSKSIETCFRMYSDWDIKISAQCYLDAFYSSFGFEKKGESYLEDGIDHQAMILKNMRYV